MTLPSIFFLRELDGYLEVLLSFVSFERAASIHEADFILYPNLLRLEKQNAVIDIARYTEGNRDNECKPVIFFVFNDYEMIVKCKTNPAIVYRTGVSRIWRLPNEFILPFLWITQPEELRIDAPRQTPVVGFCGTLFRRKSRKLTLDHFRASTSFRCNFIVRDRFTGGGSPEDRSVVEFFENIDNSDFVICDRGRGNWTIRLYEALSRGKVPVQIDTGGSLAQVKDGSWDDAIIVARTRRDLEKKMLLAWSSDFVARQHACRSLWEDNLSILGFARILSADLMSFASRRHEGRSVYSYNILHKIFFFARYLLHIPGVRHH